MITRRRISLVALFILGLLLTWQQSARASVGLTDFRATNRPTSVRLSWATGFEDNNLGFHLWRATEDDVEEAVRVTPSIIPSQSQGGSGASYVYDDEQVPGPGTYYYWLEDVDGDGVPGNRDEFYGPVTTSFGTGGGLATPTPRPTSDGGGGSEPPMTPTPTVTPAATGTIVPGASPTATSAVTNTPSPTSSSRTTATPVRASTATPDAGNPPADNRATSTPFAGTGAGSSSGAADESPPTAAATEVAAAPSTGTVEDSAPDGAPAAVAATGDTDTARDGASQSATIGEDFGPVADSEGAAPDAPPATTRQDGNSPIALMLLAVGVVLTIGGGVTAFILLRRS